VSLNEQISIWRSEVQLVRIRNILRGNKDDKSYYTNLQSSCCNLSFGEEEGIIAEKDKDETYIFPSIFDKRFNVVDCKRFS